MTEHSLNSNVTRRGFLRIIGWGSFFVTLGILIGGTMRFLFPRVLFERPSTFKAGFPHEFDRKDRADENGVFEVYEKWKDEHSACLVREKNRIYAVHVKCTHLGCTPNWFADDRIFKCPCHGSQFHSNGVNFAGPAPRPLDRFGISIADDGMIVVDKSRVYTSKDFDKRGAYLNV
ncbi:MAG: ubiquinol-cytochrome c reductase iron-sulfur subunit [Nitrospirae bacterium]|nr:ubiquinol-cytochrome c reductase iron-sulfur subunit [Nitrospirota bacterium]